MSRHYYTFFHRQKKRTLQRRTKKPLDQQALFGDKREPVLTFLHPPARDRDRDASEADSQQQLARSVRPPSASPSIRPARPPSASSTRKEAAARRPQQQQQQQQQIVLPPIDPTGRHLTAPETQPDTNIGDSVTSERKKRLLKSLEETDHDLQPPQPKYKFNEIKFASTSILSGLARRLEAQTTCDSLPEELVDSLRQDYNHLVADTIVEKREWQTDCYLDYRPRSRFPFLTSAPEEGSKLQIELDSSLSSWAVKEEIRRRARQKMSKSRKFTERPQTAKSVASIRSDVSAGSHDADRESRAEIEYDKLPPELRAQGPAILRYRRESQVPKAKVAGPRTRLEKLQGLVGHHEPKSKKSPVAKISIVSRPREFEDQQSEEEESVGYRAAGDVLHFTMTGKNFAEKGWIVRPSQQRDPEGYTLNQWANSRLKEYMRQREETKLTAKLRGEDGPLLAKHYSDAHTRSLRGGRHHRAASFPLPGILSKLPPSIASFTSPGIHDVLQVGDGVNLCLLVLPDGSGYVNYYSGRRAISLSRRGDGSRGVYTVVYDDTDAGNMMAFFMPSGNACCYHRNGAIHMLCNAKGGMLMDEDGYVTRKWEWPPAIERMGYPVTVQLNTHVVLQCTGSQNMTLKFSCHGQMHRFPVGLVPEAMEDRNESFWLTNDTLTDKLQSDLPLYSYTSKFDRERDQLFSSHDSRAASIKPHSRERLASSVSHQSSEHFTMEEEDALMCVDDLQSKKELEKYREKIMTVVNDWQNFYQGSMGLRPLSQQSPLLLSSGSQQLLPVPAGNVTHSLSRPPTRASSRAQSRLYTHPLSTSPTVFTVSRANTPGPRDTTSPRPLTPLDLVVRPRSQEQPRPFKVGMAKPRPQPPRPSKQACSLSLHEKLLKNHDTMAQCRCDKRRIPLIRDLEFDELLHSHIPKHQLVIVCVSSSKLINPLPCEPLLETLHFTHNRNRFSPCQQCTNDPYRILKYDLVHALDDVNMDVPLLVDRHNISAGMFLMYMSGRLVDASTGFNGYGNTRRDLLKQIQRSLDTGKKGQFLPQDYKFAPPSSCKLHSHSLWAYPVSGVLDEFVSYTPSSVNSSSAHSLLSVECALKGRPSLSQWPNTALDASFSHTSKQSSTVSVTELRED